MIADDLVVGAFYALKVGDGAECVRVALKSLEARYPSKVIVVPPHSDGDDSGIEVSSALIPSSWDDYVAENLELEDTAAFWDVLWIPDAGDKVELKGTDALEWKIVEISFADGEGWAVVRGEIFGRPQERTVAITELRRPRNETKTVVDELEANFADTGRAPLRWETEEPIADEPRVEPVHNLQPETVAERLVFSESARRTFRGMSRQSGDRIDACMRVEVRKSGYIGELWQPGRYVQYIVSGRFSFWLDQDPRTVEGDLWVEEIVDIRSDKAKAKFARERKAKGRRRAPKPKARPKSDARASRRRRRGGGGRK
ncbi:MAG: hypothetical protein R2725_07220 [Solirubrobacterales bacterium]